MSLRLYLPHGELEVNLGHIEKSCGKRERRKRGRKEKRQ